MGTVALDRQEHLRPRTKTANYQQCFPRHMFAFALCNAGRLQFCARQSQKSIWTYKLTGHVNCIGWRPLRTALLFVSLASMPIPLKSNMRLSCTSFHKRHQKALPSPLLTVAYSTQVKPPAGHHCQWLTLAVQGRDQAVCSIRQRCSQQGHVCGTTTAMRMLRAAQGNRAKGRPSRA